MVTARHTARTNVRCSVSARSAADLRLLEPPMSESNQPAAADAVRPPEISPIVGHVNDNGVVQHFQVLQVPNCMEQQRWHMR